MCLKTIFKKYDWDGTGKNGFSRNVTKVGLGFWWRRDWFHQGELAI